VLNDTAVMQESAAAAAEIDDQVTIIKMATGITDAEIVRVPFLHEPVSGASLAYVPGTVNGVALNSTTFASPDPHGPVIGGSDIFKTALQSALTPYGYTVRWVEDWYLYHINAGEVHCGSNAMRAIPAAKWWESGR
jgi:protein-arginine deiminase